MYGWGGYSTWGIAPGEYPTVGTFQGGKLVGPIDLGQSAFVFLVDGAPQIRHQQAENSSPSTGFIHSK